MKKLTTSFKTIAIALVIISIPVVLNNCGVSYCDEINCLPCQVLDNVNCSCEADPDYTSGCINGEWKWEDCLCDCFGGWSGYNCKDCILFTASCANGTEDVDSCKCDCDPGWTGVLCDQPINLPGPGGVMSFDFYYNGAYLGRLSSDQFISSSIDPGLIRLRAEFGDSLSVDLRIRNDGVFLQEISYPLSNDYNYSVMDANFDTAGNGNQWILYYVDTYFGGNNIIRIDSLLSDFVSGTFDCRLRNSSETSRISLSNALYWYKE